MPVSTPQKALCGAVVVRKQDDREETTSVTVVKSSSRDSFLTIRSCRLSQSLSLVFSVLTETEQYPPLGTHTRPAHTNTHTYTYLLIFCCMLSLFSCFFSSFFVFLFPVVRSSKCTPSCFADCRCIKTKLGTEAMRIEHLTFYLGLVTGESVLEFSGSNLLSAGVLVVDGENLEERTNQFIKTRLIPALRMAKGLYFHEKRNRIGKQIGWSNTNNVRKRRYRLGKLEV